MLDALHRWPTRHDRLRRPRPRGPGSELLLVGVGIAVDEERPLGCGWFSTPATSCAPG